MKTSTHNAYVFLWMWLLMIFSLAAFYIYPHVFLLEIISRLVASAQISLMLVASTAILAYILVMKTHPEYIKLSMKDLEETSRVSRLDKIINLILCAVYGLGLWYSGFSFLAVAFIVSNVVANLVTLWLRINLEKFVEKNV